MAILDPLALSAVYENLIQFADSPHFWQDLEIIFGSSFNRAKAEELRQQWQAEDFSQLPPIRILDQGMAGLLGAYAQSTDTIYLNQTFLETASPAQIQAVLLEEIGHAIDARLNVVDSLGDEGEIFAHVVSGIELDDLGLQSLRSQKDNFTIFVDGNTVPVEAAVFLASSFTDLVTAINNANSSSGADTIRITGDIRLTSFLPLITSDIEFIGNGYTISGDANNNGVNDAGDVSIFFVKEGTVSISNLTLSGGRAQGGKGGNGLPGGGGGMGAGGALLINSGNVTLTNVTFSNNQAIGGNGGDNFDGSVGFTGGGGGGGLSGNGGNGGASSSSPGNYGGGGGGLRGDGGEGSGSSPNRVGGGGGGTIDNASGFGVGGNANGGNGGVEGTSSATAGGFGGGGGAAGGLNSPSISGANGGEFGGGGGGVGIAFSVSGKGGFGGGGGGSSFVAGSGGFGGGNGGGDSIGPSGGSGGFGAGGGGGGGFVGGGGGAGLGGAIFIRSGYLTMSDTTFTGNSATGGKGGTNAADGQGLGGAIFAVTDGLKDEAGVTKAPTVLSLGGLPTFSNNTAPDDAGDSIGNTYNDNNIFGTLDIVLPTLSIDDVKVNENAGTATFTVSLSIPAFTSGVTFDIATANNTATAGQDYTARSLTGQTIAAGESTYTFTVDIKSGNLSAATETFFVNVTNVTGANVLEGQGLGAIVNVNEAPTNITLDNTKIDENTNTSGGLKVAVVTITDPDA
ncbi:Calx-beta domain-containing protein, partial [Synechocystis sp. CACIAM 05]|uniref:Calx-beta domain-containing protein n=1 Tax=Synechocystis sp. CACIAM 05 TaxID=1933929 RepID=UPI00138E6416